MTQRYSFNSDTEYLEWLRKVQKEGARKGGLKKNKNKGFGSRKKKA